MHRTKTWLIAFAAVCLSCVFTADAHAQLNYPDILYYKFNTGSGRASQANDAFPREGNSSANFRYYTSSYDIYPTTGRVRNAQGQTTNGVYNRSWDDDYAYYCDTGWNFNIAPDDDFTMEFWARYWYYTGYGRSHVFGTPSYNYCSAYNESSNRMYFGFGGHQLDSRVQTVRSPSSSTWTHYAMVYEAAKREVRIYIDGNLTNTYTNITPNQSSQRMYLYNYRNDYGCCNVYYHMRAYMDELRLWRRARTQAEIQANMGTELTKPTGFFVGPKSVVGETRVEPRNDVAVWRGTLGASSTSASLQSLTFTKTGSLPDNMITSVKLYYADSNGNPSGGARAQGTYTNGQVTLNESRSFSSDEVRDYVLTYDISTSAPGGTTFGATLASESDVNVNGATAIAFSDAAGPDFTLISPVSALPWTANFDTLPGNSRWFHRGQSVYPYASSPNNVNRSWYWSTSSPEFPVNNRVESSSNGVSALSQPNMATMGWTGSSSHNAFDLLFDLSNYDINSDQVIFEFNWYDNGKSSQNNEWEGIFLSLNGGSSYLRKIYTFDFNANSGQWNNVKIDLQDELSQANQTQYPGNLMIRISNLGSWTGDRIHFDDFSVYSREPSLAIERPNLRVPAFPVAPGASDVPVHAARVSALVDPQEITSVKITKTGNIADSEISAVKLFADGNGNGYFDAGDTQLGMDATFTNGEATFMDTPNLASLAADDSTTLFVTYSLDAMATPRATLGASIASSMDVSITSGDPVTAMSFPFEGPELQVAGDESLPFFADFESGLPVNLSGSTAVGSQPAAASVTTTVGSGFTGKPGRVQLNEGDFEGLSAFSGRNSLSIDFPGAAAVGAGAIDFSFDLSNYDAMTDSVTFSFWVNQFAGGEDNSDMDGVFISDDGGATWLAKAWHPNWASINGWTRVDVNVSDLMNGASASFTNDMLIRIQAADDLGAPWDGIAIDNVFCGLSAVASVSWQGTDIADGGMVNVGNLGLNGASQITFDIANLGHQDLDVGDAFNAVNATNIDSTVGVDFVPSANGDSFTVSLQPEMTGAFSVDLEIPFPNDPTLTGGIYTITLEGEGGIEPTITSTAPTIATVGRMYSYQIVADGSPAPTFSLLGAPSWLALNGDVLSGTPAAGDVGPQPDFSITATNSVGMDATEIISITVSQEVEPTITSTPITMATVGQVYQYILSADGAPEPTFTVTGLPSWLTQNGNVITGTAAAQPGTPVPTYTTGSITVTATNGIGLDDQQTFEITVVDPAVAANAQITTVPTTTIEAGVLYTYSIGVTGNPDPTVMASGLPAWASFDANTNTISGTPASTDAGSTAEITITAENGVGQAAAQSFVLTVLDASVAPRILSVPTTFVQLGQDFSYVITTSGSPAPTLDVQGLPDWLSFDSATSTISGMPLGTHVGLSGSIIVTASNGIGTDDVQAFNIIVIPAPSESSDESTCSLSAQGGNSAIWYMLSMMLAAGMLALRKRMA